MTGVTRPEASPTGRTATDVPLTGSVVIPAHDEAARIGRGLRAIEASVLRHGLEVVVVCNGCTDDTADRARQFAWARVLEIAEASKPAALRTGDAAVDVFPRLYLDADVELPSPALDALLLRFAAGDVAAARPPVHYDVERCSWPVRCYFRARLRVPALTSALWGAGVYALSAQGRARFETFPDIVADDLFVDGLFSAADMAICAGTPVRVDPPRRVRELLRVLRRTYRGKAQLTDTMGPALRRRTAGVVSQLLSSAVRQGPRAVADAGVYVTLVCLARLQLRALPGERWERDESSRS